MTHDGIAGSECLVVGGAGFIGSNLVHALLNHGVAGVEVVDNLLSSVQENLPSDDRINFVEASINDAHILRALPGRFDYVFHMATFHGNQNSIARPLEDHEHNTLTTLNLCEALAGDHRLRKLVYASAGCTVAEKTYGDPVATTEDAPVSLYHDSPYQISKIVGEFYLNYYFERHGLPGVKARFQNVYGPGEVLGAGEWRGTPATVWRNVVPTFIYRSLQNLPLTLHNGGRASRDFIYVGDIVDGLLRCAVAGPPGEVLNLATGEETTIGDLARLILELSGSNSQLDLQPARDWDRSGNRYGSTDKSSKVLEFRASTQLRDGLIATIEWFRANELHIQSAIDQHAGALHSADA